MRRWLRRTLQGAVVVGVAARLLVPRPGELYATGLLEAAARGPVYAQVDGAISEVLVAEGDRVVAGQVVGRLASARLTAVVQREELELRKRQSGLEALVKGTRREELVRGSEALVGKRRVLAAVETELRRAERMHKEKLASSEELLLAQDRVAQARAEVAAAAADFRLLQGGARPAEIERQQAIVAAQDLLLQKALADVAATDLRAPIDGVVVALDEAAHVAGHLNAGDRFCDVVDDGALRIAIRVPERELHELTLGMSVAVRPASAPDVELAGTVIHVLPLIERASSSPERLVKVVVALANPERRLRPSSQATVEMKTVARRPIAALIAPIVRWFHLRFYF